VFACAAGVNKSRAVSKQKCAKDKAEEVANRGAAKSKPVGRTGTSSPVPKMIPVTMFVRRVAAGAALCLIVGSAETNAADVTMGDNWCDDGLPIYASDMVLDCGNEGDGCHLGQSAGVYASLTFNGVADAVSNNLVYVTLKVSKFEDITSYVTSSSISKDLMTLEEANICNSAASNNGGCPADGSYYFKASYTLPSAGDKDWFLTGQHFGAEVKVYSDSSGDNLIGDCHARMTTLVTAGASRFMDPPSATKAAGITLIVLAVAVVGIVMGCRWMDRRDRELEGSDFEMLEDPRAKQNAVV